MHAGSAAADQPRPIREICDEHEGEWLLIKILDASAPMGDAPGLLLAHSSEYGAMFKAERKIRKLDSTSELTIVGGGTKFGDGAALRRALARIAAEEDWVSVNNW